MADGNIYIPVELDDKEAVRKLEKINRDINKLENDIAKGKATELPLTQQLETLRKSTESARKSVAKLKDERQQLEKKTAITAHDIDPNEFLAAQDRLEEVKAALERQEPLLESQEKEQRKIEGQAEKVRKKYEEQTADLERAKAQAGELSKRVSKVKDVERLHAGFENVKKSITGGTRKLLLWGFAIRSVYALVRKLRTYLSEAIKTYAANDPETRANIEGLKNALANLKAQWGAAFGPVLALVMPLLQHLVQWLTAAANAVSAFFAALGGKKSYKRAITNLNGVAGAASGAAAAAKEAKKQFMGIDDLTIFEDNKDQGSGGGSGGTGSDVRYEDVDIMPGAEAFADKVRPIIEWLVDNLPFVRDLAVGIGAALLGWKISRALGADISQAGAIAALLLLIVMDVKNYLDMWENGIDWDGLIMHLGLVAAAALIAGIAFGLPAAGIILIVGGIAALILAVKEWLETGELTNEMIAAIVGGILAVGAGIALVAGGWIPLVVAAVAAAIVGIGLLLYKNWDKIKKWFQENVVKGAREGWENLKKDFQNFMTAVKERIAAGKRWWNAHITEPLHNFVASVLHGYLSTLIEGWNNAIHNIKTGWTNFLNDAQLKWEDFTKIFKGLVQLIATPFVAAINAVLSAYNAMVGIINSKRIEIPPITVFGRTVFEGTSFGLNLPTAGLISMNWAAKGGIVDGATLIGAGEAGKEAIVPLERNTQWITTLAKRLADVMLDENMLDDIADRVAKIPAAIDRLTGELVSLPPFPAVASGTMIPPGTLGGAGIGQDLADKLSAFLDSVQGENGTPFEIHTHLHIDRREIGEAVTQYQIERERGRGR